MFLTSRKGAESNARLSGFAAQVENCDWSDAGGRCNSGGGSFFSAGGLAGIAADANLPTQGGPDEEDPRGGTVARHGREDQTGEGPDQRVLQEPLCRQGFRTAR